MKRGYDLLIFLAARSKDRSLVSLVSSYRVLECLLDRAQKKRPEPVGASGVQRYGLLSIEPAAADVSSEADQWNCSSSVEPVSAVTEDEPPWITVVMSSK